ncbi:DNA-3-methyladenine glycosylase I [Lacticaseibacillus brantae]|uniref:3-methyladenine DNA glycosylase n=1 Tax=Lacticaseibacillus brantae DSM 23927 TaxID=1423727 RepID=A0A0R2AZQ4_9LACO|nr:DNA-3-methyladenine glycosylase I [Lacticaseibacillus brantae]KRM72018.1 3-methyladenine DNA glycosylase [Lacticaseibacillus brantae DSM 23927]
MADEDFYWANATPELRAYHDQEWGIPQHGDDNLFELLSLETYQAGLSWQIVLKKRAAFNKAFHHFQINRVAKMTSEEIDALMTNPDIIRNRRKLEATVTNAQAIQRVQAEFGSFDQYLWDFVAGEPIVNAPKSPDEVPAQTELSQLVSKDMKKRGFKFVGPVTIYSYLQGAGLVDDHLA